MFMLLGKHVCTYLYHDDLCAQEALCMDDSWLTMTKTLDNERLSKQDSYRTRFFVVPVYCPS